MIDFLVVGAGVFGATCARLLADAGKTVHVIERRGHIAGNCYDEKVDDLLVNRYGGHIFHTNSRKVWEFVSRFSDWIPYEHRVKARVGLRTYSFPINLMTLQQVYGVRSPFEAGILAPKGQMPDDLRRMFFEGYSWKQWGEVTPHGVVERIPMRMTWDDRYYSDLYQGMPVEGYTKLVENMLGDCPVTLDTDFLGDQEYWMGKAHQVIYSGPIDELFGCDLGKLPYRSLEWQNLELPRDFQGCATVNYCDREVPQTRILEWQHYGHRSRPGKTLITYEYAVDYVPGKNLPMYPVASEASEALYQQYKARVPEGIFVGGRLGSYRYWNMDQAMAQAMRLCGEL